jgi:hypothetical protein
MRTLVMLRGPVILAVCLSVFLTCSLSLNNGLVLHIGDHGHFVLEAPDLLHVHEHADGAAHESHERGSDTDHGDLHDLIGVSSASAVCVQKIERTSLSFAATHSPFVAHLCAPSPSTVDLLAVSDHAVRGSTIHRGGNARIELTCLHSIILIV